VLDRGYAVITRPDGKKVTSVSQVTSGDELSVRVRDGEFGVKAKELPR
jgi:exonuclease VII large subunit